MDLDAIPFTKGHGTQNDFVVLDDLGVALDLTAKRVAALCDRPRGIGADGVLRVAKAGALRAAGVLDALPKGVAEDDWFMDYRNADGSVAEMCGNGVRVFAHYLVASGQEARTEFTVGSRAGARPVVVHDAGPVHGEVTVNMGPVVHLGPSTAAVGGRSFEGIGIDVGNPHLACVDEHLTPANLKSLDLSATGFDPGLFPGGVNIEVITPLRDGAVEMRVHERGVGETRACGTGTVAAAAAALHSVGRTTGEVTVRQPGGSVHITIDEATSYLRGPSVLVGNGSVSREWWDAQ